MVPWFPYEPRHITIHRKKVNWGFCLFEYILVIKLWINNILEFFLRFPHYTIQILLPNRGTQEKKSMSKSINRGRFLLQAKEKRKSRLYFMYIPCDQNCSSCFTHVHIESQQLCEIFCLHYGDEASGIHKHVLTG